MRLLDLPALVGLTLVMLGLGPRAEAQLVALAHHLTVDVPAVETEGDFPVDVLPPGAASGELGAFALAPLEGPRIWTFVGTTANPGFGPLWLVPGAYQPVYGLIQGEGVTLPLGGPTPVGPPVDVDGLTPVDVTLPAMNFHLTLQIDGEDVPTTFGESAALSLRDVVTGVEFEIGDATDSPLAVQVVPGVYDLIYRYVSGSELPRNTRAVIAQRLDLSGRSVATTVDVATVMHGVGATLNGAPFPTSPYEDGEIRLENPDTGDRVSWGMTTGLVGLQRILAGTYDVVYAHESGNSIVPANQRAVIAEDVEIAPPAHPWQLSTTDVDVVAHMIDVAGTLDGAPFPASAYEHGEIVLVGQGGDEVPLGFTSGLSDPIPIVEGVYDLHYRRVTGNLLMPLNAEARVMRGVRVDAPATLAFDVETVEVTLDFLLDGEPFPASAYERGAYRLVGETPGDEMEVGSTVDPQHVVRVVPGRYDLEYDYVTGTSIVPANVGQRVESDLEFLTDHARTIDIVTRAVVPTFLMNGGAFPTDPSERGEIVLRSFDGGMLSLGTTDVVDPDARIAIEAAYAVDYQWETGTAVPRNALARVAYTHVPEPGFAPGLALAGAVLARFATRRRPGHRRGRAARRGGSWAAAALAVACCAPSPATSQSVGLAHFLTVDIESVEASGDILIDGVPAPASAAESALVELAPAVGPPFAVGATNAQAWGPTRLIAGEFRPVYEFFFSSGALPINQGTPVGPVTLIGATPVDIDIETVDVVFDFRLNGGGFPATDLADFLLRHRESGAEFPIGTSTQSPIAAKVVPGRYDVIYAHRSGTLVPRNSHAVVLEDVLLTVSKPLVIDVAAFPHILEALHNGAPFLPSPLETGEIELRNFETGDRVSFGPTHAPESQQMILPGTYDVTYSRILGGTASPANDEVVVAEGLVLAPPPIPNVISFSSIDVPTVQVDRDVTLDGAPFVQSTAERGRIILVGAQGEEIDLGPTNEASPTRRVVPGVYDVHIRRMNGVTFSPANTNARIAKGVVIDADMTIAVDVQSVVLDLALTVDGQPFPDSTAEYAEIRLVGETPGDVIEWGRTDDPLSPRRVVAGRYDLVYDYVRGDTIIPRNQGTLLVSGEHYAVDTTIAVDVGRQVVVPTFRLDGAPFPMAPADSARIVMRDALGGEVDLGTTDEAEPPSVFVIPGAYGVDYQWEAGLGVPRNPLRRVAYTSVPEPGFGVGVATASLGLAIGAARCGRSGVRRQTSPGRGSVHEPRGERIG